MLDTLVLIESSQTTGHQYRWMAGFVVFGLEGNIGLSAATEKMLELCIVSTKDKVSLVVVLMLGVEDLQVHCTLSWTPLEILLGDIQGLFFFFCLSHFDHLDFDLGFRLLLLVPAGLHVGKRQIVMPIEIVKRHMLAAQ